jgi:hypothetical protein
MALPHRAVATFSILGNEDGTTPRADSYVEGDFHDLGTPHDGSQQSFYSYRWFYKNYPNEILKVVPSAVQGYQNLQVVFDFESPAEFIYPDNRVVEYFPDDDPAPDPNGTTGIDTGNLAFSGVIGPEYPRWVTDTPYDFSANLASWGSMIPQPGISGVWLEIPEFGVSGGPWSWDLSVANLSSEVLNLDTDELEYYPFAQATTSFKATANFKVTFNAQICCWNEGTVIRGKVGFKSVNVTVTAVPSALYTGNFNWAGLGYEVGSTYTDAGTADWEVTIDEDFVPPNVDIPKVAGAITFVNDFWITEVIPPA